MAEDSINTQVYTKAELKKYKRILNDFESYFWDQTSTDTFRKDLETVCANGYPIDFHVPMENDSLLFRAIYFASGQKDQAAKVHAVLDMGADVNMLNDVDQNALVYAARQAGMFPELIERIANSTKDINLKDFRGYTALGYLCSRFVTSGSPETLGAINMLLELGADASVSQKWRKMEIVPPYGAGYAEEYEAKLKDNMKKLDAYMMQREETLQNITNRKYTALYDYEI